jgi:ATP-dependent DNA ligase
MAYWAVKDSVGNIVLYSRRNRLSHKDEGPKELNDGTLDHSQLIPWTARFPHLVQALQALQLPNNSMLALELVHPGGDSKAHFSHVQSVTKSLTTQALKDQEEKIWLVAYIWDIPFWDGKEYVKTVRTSWRHKLIVEILEKAPAWVATWLSPVQYHQFPSLDASLQYALEAKLEGWVVVDPEGVYDDKAWNLKGKPDRPSSFCAKAKPWMEDDFVAMWDPSKKIGTLGKGRHEKGKTVTLPNRKEVKHGGVGSVGLHQYNSDGSLVYICDCSSGMDYEMQSCLTPKNFPMVWEVQYVERSYISDGDKTNALTFPKLVRVRTDKTPEECINDEL